MTPTQPSLGDFGFAGDDTVVPFEVAALDVRGRTVQLGEARATNLEPPANPEPV